MKLLVILVAALFFSANSEYSQSYDPEKHFKLTALYFADSVLKGLTVDDQNVEGAVFLEVFEQMGQVFAEQDDAKVKSVGESFKRGLAFSKALDEAQNYRHHRVLAWEAKLPEAEASLFKIVKGGQEVTFTSGWVGHAVLMSLAPSAKGSDFFDLRVFNMGDGIEFHEVVADSAGTYPYLIKPWVSYLGIPWKLVEDDPFLALGLANLKNPVVMGSFEEKSNYFYGELLGNFDAYRAIPAENGNQMFAVAQRSGTCTVSSCVARLMFEYGTMAQYLRSRIKIGIFLLKFFVEKYKNDSEILKKAKSGVQFKKVLNFALSSLAREAFNMLSLENVKDQYTCFPTTQKFKAFMTAQDSQTCNAKISTEDFEILKQVTEVSLQMLTWLESIKLDLFKFSTEAKLNIGESSDYVVGKMTKKLPKTKFSALVTENNNKLFNGARHILHPPHILADNMLTESASVLQAIVFVTSSRSSSYFCLNLIKLTELIDFSQDPPNPPETKDIYSWHSQYKILYDTMGQDGEVFSMECLLAFQKLSLYIWKIAVLQDAKAGALSLGLSEYAPPIGACPGSSSAVHEDLLYFETARIQRLQARNLDVFTEAKKFCDQVKAASEGKKPFYTSLKLLAEDRDTQKFLVNPEIIGKLKGTQAFELFLKTNEIEPFREKEYPSMIQCASSDELIADYPQFYLLQLVAFATTSLRETNRCRLSGHEVCKYNYKISAMSYWRVPNKEGNDYKPPNTAFIKNNIEDIVAANSVVSFFAILDEIEHVNAASLFKGREFNSLLDKVLFSSTLLVKVFTEHPSAAPRLLTAFNALFRLLETNFGAKLSGSEVKIGLIQGELEILAELSYIYSRVMYKVLLLTADKHAETIKASWTALQKFWLNYSGVYVLADSRVNQTIDSKRFGMVNLLLASMLSLAGREKHLICAVATAYGHDSDNFTGISALKAAHYFAGKNSFEKNVEEGKKSSLLEDLLMSNDLLNEIIKEVHSHPLNQEILDPLLETLLKRIVGNTVEATKFEEDPDLMSFLHKGENGKDSKIYRIRLSTAEITENDRRFVSKRNFLNAPQFAKFFGQDLAHAISGTMNSAFWELAYEINNFLVEGADYRIFLDTSDMNKLKIYRKIGHLSPTRYFKLRDSSENSFEKSKFGLVNTMGLDTYELISDNYSSRPITAYEYVWIPRDGKEPVYYGQYEGGKASLEIPALNTGQLEFLASLNMAQGVKSYDDYQFQLSPALMNFATKFDLSVYQREDYLVAVIQPFIMTASTPLAFKIESLRGTEVDTAGVIDIDHKPPTPEPAKTSRIVWLNDPSYVLHSQQVINEEEPFSPMLILKKESEADAFIALIPDLDYNKLMKSSSGTYAAENYVNVHKIELRPDLKGFAVHTRLEKLLLAYHNLFNWNFKEALKLLKHDSIHHNAPFNAQESALLQKIFSLDQMSHPEGIALQLIAGFHLQFNDYENLIKSSISEPRLEKLLSTYSMSMRDISKQFYIHLRFPELVVEELDIFKAKPPTIAIKDGSPGKLEPVSIKIEQNGSYNPIHLTELNILNARNLHILAFKQVLKTWDSEKRLPEKVKALHIVDQILKTPENNGINHKFWNTLFKLRRPKANNEYLTAYCLIVGAGKEPIIKDALKSFESAIEKAKEDPSKITSITIDLPQCTGIVEAEIERKYFAPTRTTTDPQLILSLMRDDVKEKAKLKNNNSPESFDFTKLTVSTSAEAKLFAELASAIDKDWFEQKKVASHCLPKSNNILQQLNESIKLFDTERRSFAYKSFADKNSKIWTDIDVIDQHLTKRIKELAAGTERQKNDMADFTSSSQRKTTLSWILNHLDKIFHQKKDKVFDHLYGCYFTNNSDCFSNKFPHLSPQEIKKLQEMTFVYYAECNLLNYLEYLKKLFDDLKGYHVASSEEDAFTIESLAKEIVIELLKMEEFKGRIKQPGLLNFEFRSGNVRLRKEQVKDVLDLKEIDSKTSLPVSTVIQRMMAAGKTFVLGTLASVLKADGKTLSILVPPSSLYQSNAVSMQERTLKYFKSRGRTFHFPRLSSTSHFSENLLFLKLVLDRIKRTIASKDYLIMDPSDLSAFHNSYIEHLENVRIDPKNKKNLKLLHLHVEIYQIFKQKTSIILDEIDMTMAPKLELNYPTHDMEKMNMAAATLTADLLWFTVYSEEIKSLGLIISKNNQANFDQANIDKVRSFWRKHVEEKLKDQTGVWYQAIIRPAKSVSGLVDDSFPRKVVEFIFEPVLATEFAEKLEASSKLAHSTLAILRMQVQKWIPESFSGAVFEKYGPSIVNWSIIKYAIPYLSANTPSERSVFADRWETLNKTLLMYIIKPFGFEEISALALAILNMKAERDPSAAALEKLFEKLTHLVLKDLMFDSNERIITKESVPEIEKAFSNKTEEVLQLIFVYVLRHVMEPIEYFQEQITSNALNMTSMFGSVQGYSGTIDNINTLPWQLVAIAEKERLANEKNNGGIVAKLLDDARNDATPITVLKSELATAVELLEEALVGSIKGEFNAFIDVGAFFKAFRNFKVAEAIMETFTNINYVIYYDEKSNQTRYIKRTTPGQEFELPTADLRTVDKNIRLQECFTFYDQRHITGSDIRQHPKAKALLSVGPKVLLRDILQGTLRLRQFMAGQKVRFVTTESVIHLLGSKKIFGADDETKAGKKSPKIEHLIALAAANENDKQSKENVKLAYTKIDNEIRDFVLKALAEDVLADASPKKIAKKFESVRPFFIRSTRENPSQWLKAVEYGKTEEALGAYLKAKISLLQGGFGEVKELESRLNDLAKDLKRFLDSTMPRTVSSSEGIELHLEIQQEQEADQEADLSVDQMLEQELAIVNMFAKSDEKKKTPGFDDIYKHVFWGDKNVFVEGLRAMKLIRKQETGLAVIGLGPVKFSFAAELIRFVNSFSPTTIYSTVAKEGHGIIFFRDESSGTEKMILLDAEGISNVLDDIARENYQTYSTASSMKYCFADMAGNYIGPENGPAFLLKTNLFDIPGWKERHLDSFFTMHLFNGGMNYISTVPELREQFGRWLRLLDVRIKDRSSATVFKRLKFLAMKLKSPKKDEFIFDKKTDPFIRIIYEAIAQQDHHSYQLLLDLFPEKMSRQTKALEIIKFVASKLENIWKFFKTDLFKMDFEADQMSTEAPLAEDQEYWDAHDRPIRDEMRREVMRITFRVLFALAILVALVLLIIYVIRWIRQKQSLSKSDEDSSEEINQIEQYADDEAPIVESFDATSSVIEEASEEHLIENQV